MIHRHSLPPSENTQNVTNGTLRVNAMKQTKASENKSFDPNLPFTRYMTLNFSGSQLPYPYMPMLNLIVSRSQFKKNKYVNGQMCSFVNSNADCFTDPHGKK